MFKYENINYNMWKHMHATRFFSDGEKICYDKNLLLRKTPYDVYILRYYNDEHGAPPEIVEHYFNNIVSIQIVDHTEINDSWKSFTLTIKFVCNGVTESIKMSRLTYNDSIAIRDFITNI